MHERLKALKPLLKAGDYDKAEEALTAYREEFPDDWDGRLMEGIVAQLKGDEATFRRIHDEAQAVIDRHGKDGAQIQASPLWKKYHKAWGCITEAVVICLVVAVTGTAGLALFNRPVNQRLRWAWKVITVGKQEADKWLLNYSVPTMALYDGPDDFDGSL